MTELKLTHGSSEHYTPTAIIEAARTLMGGSITLDPASCQEANDMYVKAKGFYGVGLNGLFLPWHGNVWLNPPYGYGNKQSDWVSKLIAEYKSAAVNQACILVQANTAQKWFQPLWNYPLCFFTPRIQFMGPGGLVGDQPRHAHALAWLPPNQQWGATEMMNMRDVFGKLGAVVARVGS